MVVKMPISARSPYARAAAMISVELETGPSSRYSIKSMITTERVVSGPSPGW